MKKQELNFDCILKAFEGLAYRAIVKIYEGL
jgi:hypothetical protein